VIRLGLAQFLSQEGVVESNRAKGVDAAKRLFGDGADIVLLPELTVPWYTTEHQILSEFAEDIEGPTVVEWQRTAAENDGVIIGGFCEYSEGNLYNTAVAVSETGVLAHYRKLHLFAAEKHCFQPGDLGLPVFQTRFGTIGLCICYDLRFVEVVRILALRHADLVCVPTAWVPGFDQSKWDEKGLCPQAEGACLQANLSQVFVACASQVGESPSGGILLGSSIVAGPDGKLKVGPLSGTSEVLAVAEFDIGDVHLSRSRSALIRPREDRRSDVYGVQYLDEML